MAKKRLSSKPQCAIARCRKRAYDFPGIDYNLCLLHGNMWISFVHGWEIGSGKKDKEYASEVFPIFKESADSYEFFMRCVVAARTLNGEPSCSKKRKEPKENDRQNSNSSRRGANA